MHKKIFINTDGGARGNPGPAAIGIILWDESHKELEAHKERIGTATNNTAEYKAVIKALELAEKYTENEVELASDSELVIRQLNNEYSVKQPHLQKLFAEAKKKEKNFEKVAYRHVKRADKHQAKADELVNLALDEE